MSSPRSLELFWKTFGEDANLAGACSDIGSALRGSADPLSDVQLANALTALRLCNADWRVDDDKISRATRELLIQTIHALEQEQRERTPQRRESC